MTHEDVMVQERGAAFSPGLHCERYLPTLVYWLGPFEPLLHFVSFRIVKAGLTACFSYMVIHREQVDY